MSGKHYKRAAKRAKKYTPGATREFTLSRRRKSASYFFFTLFVCLMLALSAIAALKVDFSGRSVRDGDEPKLAFKVSEAGEAKLTLLGRDYFADVSFLSPVFNRISAAGELIVDRTPAAVKYAINGLPRLYEQMCRAAATLEKPVFDALND